MRICATCRHFPREISLEDSAFLEEMVRQHTPDVLQAWSDARTLRFCGPSSVRFDLMKIRFFELNSPIWCAQEKAMISAAELACFAWKPRELVSHGTRVTG